MPTIDDTEQAELDELHRALRAAQQPRELADVRRTFLRSLLADSNPRIASAAKAELSARSAEWQALTEAHDRASRAYTEGHMRIRSARFRRAKHS